MRHGVRKNLIGTRVGRLLVTGLSDKIFSTNQRYRWECLCDCGNTTLVGTHQLTKAKTKSCGCLRAEFLSGTNNPKVKALLDKHGTWVGAKTPWYNNASRIRSEAKKNNLPFGFGDITEFAMYVKEITPELCPVFGEPLIHATGKRNKWSISVDKIIPEKGYVQGNIQVLSSLANTMKQDATPKQLVKFAVWVLKSVLGEEVKILWKGKEIK
jgi:hypothetical protein